MTTEYDIIQWVDSLADPSLEGYTPFRINHYIEMYCLEGKKSMISPDSIIFRNNILYAIYSPVEARYYLRHTKPLLEGESVSDRLKTYIKDKNMWLMFTADDIEDMDATLRRLHKYYYKEDGKMDYRVYVRLIITTLAKDSFVRSNRSMSGYKSGVAEYDRKIKQILNN